MNEASISRQRLSSVCRRQAYRDNPTFIRLDTQATRRAETLS